MSNTTEKKIKALPAPLISFLIGTALFILLLFINGFLGLSGGSICLGDPFDQYFAFIIAFLDVIKGKRDFWYSFSLYAGSGSALTYAYYAFSPFNILYLIPGLSIITITHIISSLKAGLAAASFTYYSQKTLGLEKKAAIFFSLCYTFCSWAVIMSINPMWADSLYILPLLIVFLKQVSAAPSRKNFLLLTFCYSYLFLTNFYMGYVFGIFTALYFIGSVICSEAEISADKFSEHVLSVLKKTLIFTASVILAAAIDAAILLPVGYFLIHHLRGTSDSFVSLSATLPDILSSVFACEGYGLYSAIPYIYCGLPVLILLPFYFFSKNIALPKKIFAAVLLVFYLCGSTIIPLYAFLHAFDNPNHYPFRFSACIVFILISMAAQVWNSRTRIASRSMWIYVAVLSGIYAFLVLFNDITGYSHVSNTYFVINTALLALWACIFLFLQKTADVSDGDTADKKKKTAFQYFIFLLLATELLLSSSIGLRSFAGAPEDNNLRISAEEFNNWYSKEKEAADYLKNADANLYRVRVDGERIFNGASLFGINTLTSFASYEEKPTRNALSGLGIGNAYHMIYDVSGLSFNEMLLGVKYHINLDDNGNVTITPNETSLPIAFTVSSDIAAYTPGPNPFENINNMACRMTGAKIPVFEPVSPDVIETNTFNAHVYELGDMTAFEMMTDNVTKGWITYGVPKVSGKTPYVYFVPQNGTYFNSPAPYFQLTNPIGLVCTPTISGGALFPVNNEINQTETNSKTELEEADDRSFMTLYINTNGFTSYAVNDTYFAYYDEQAVQMLYDYLSAGSMTVSAHSDDHIEGTVISTAERPVLYTTIPYDKGWSAIVDGVPSKIYVTTSDAFCALALTPGEHHIEFTYEAPYAFAGSVISTIAIMIVLLIFLRKDGSKTIKNNITGQSGKEDQVSFN